jgi:hypothetical protein
MFMKKFLSLSVLLLLLAGCFEFAEAQVNRAGMRRKNRQISTFTMSTKFPASRRYVTLGAHIGTATYFGDIAPRTSVVSFDPSFTRPSVGLYGSYRIHPNIGLRGMFSWVRIQGDDFKSQDTDDLSARYRYIRNHHFRNDIKELSIGGTFDLYGNNSSFVRRRTINPYAFASIAVFHHNPKALAPEGTEEEGRWVSLQPLGTEGQGRAGYARPYSLVQVGVPLGLGIKYKLTDLLDLAFEVGYRLTFTNYLDDVGGMYADPNDFEAGSLAQQMAFRSAEATAAYTGENRNIEAVAANISSSYTVRTANGVPYVNGWAFRNQIRGGSSGRDYYVVTGFHLSYILADRSRAPKFR